MSASGRPPPDVSDGMISGLCPFAIKEFGLGYCSRGLMKNRVVIPVHDEHGQLVAYAPVPAEDVLEDEPKYLIPPNWNLWND